MAINKVVYDGNTLIDLTSTTATADKILVGYGAFGKDGVWMDGTATGGGGGSVATKNDVNFYDYDGTILYSYSATEANALTSLPANPSHSGLTAQGWNYTLAQMKTQISATGTCDIGQMYITDDGKTRIYCTFEEGRLSPYFGIGVNGTVTVDWGDNSASDTLTGTSLTTAKKVQHTYASAGDYVIRLTVESGSFSFFGVSATSHILKASTATTASISRVYTNSVKKIEMGSNSLIGVYAFNYCYSLSSITIPSGVTNIGIYSFQYCYSLASITIPSGVTSIGTYAFNYCYSLSSITIPSSVTSIGASSFQTCYTLTSITIPSGITSIQCFQSCYSLHSIMMPSGVTNIGNNGLNACYSLASITIPSSVTSIGNSSFYNCYSLTSITIPSGVTAIGTSAFSGCYGAKEYHFLPIAPPTLANTNAFASIQSDCIIYVPSGSLEAYQTATNWSTYASYMQEE